MVRIVGDPIGKDVGELAHFLEEKLGLKPKVDGNVIVVEPKEETELKVGVVKTHLKRFLHRKDIRRRYRLSIRQGEIRFVPTGAKEEK